MVLGTATVVGGTVTITVRVVVGATAVTGTEGGLVGDVVAGADGGGGSVLVPVDVVDAGAAVVVVGGAAAEPGGATDEAVDPDASPAVVVELGPLAETVGPLVDRRASP